MAQEISEKTISKLQNEDEVRPFDKEVIYSTGVGFHSEGEKLEVHPLLAAKLIAQGKATKDAPKKGK